MIYDRRTMRQDEPRVTQRYLKMCGATIQRILRPRPSTCTQSICVRICVVNNHDEHLRRIAQTYGPIHGSTAFPSQPKAGSQGLSGWPIELIKSEERGVSFHVLLLKLSHLTLNHGPAVFARVS